MFVVWQDNRALSVYTKAGLSGWLLFWGQISEICSQITVTGPKIFIWPFAFGSFLTLCLWLDWTLARIRYDHPGSCLRLRNHIFSLF